jgi:hypothetical protein
MRSAKSAGVAKNIFSKREADPVKVSLFVVFGEIENGVKKGTYFTREGFRKGCGVKILWFFTRNLLHLCQ